jgi:predicted HicB family RNase H-like nuclease
VKFMLDFSEDLRTKVKVKAAEQKTSMNDLIIKAIQMYLAAKKGEQ